MGNVAKTAIMACNIFTCPAIFLLLLSVEVFGEGLYTISGQDVVVTSSLNEPFLMHKPDAASRLGNDKYDGYIVDLLNELSGKLQSNFYLKLASDGRYGAYDNTTDSWTGMVGEVITGDVDLLGAGEADMAAADLSVTAIRESAVDFTHPFMHVGITILYKKPSWARSLTVSISSVDDLARQTKIKFGTVQGGSTYQFFETSKVATNKKIWEAMEANDDVFTANNIDGVQRVLDGDGEYAFFIESASAEYHAAKNCQLTKVGGLISSKSYGIALPQGSPHREELNIALLELQEEGVLDMIKEKWWKAEVCQEEDWTQTVWNLLPSV